MEKVFDLLTTTSKDKDLKLKEGAKGVYIAGVE